MEVGQKRSPIWWNRKFLNNMPLVVSCPMPVLSNTDFRLWVVGQLEIGDVKPFFARVCEQLLVFES